MASGPEDLNELIMLQSSWKAGANRITDADGDGVEDNIAKTRDELDRFYEPLVFKYATAKVGNDMLKEINNTHHGSHAEQDTPRKNSLYPNHYKTIKTLNL